MPDFGGSGGYAVRPDVRLRMVGTCRRCQLRPSVSAAPKRSQVSPPEQYASTAEVFRSPCLDTGTAKGDSARGAGRAAARRVRCGIVGVRRHAGAVRRDRGREHRGGIPPRSGITCRPSARGSGWRRRSGSRCSARRWRGSSRPDRPGTGPSMPRPKLSTGRRGSCGAWSECISRQDSVESNLISLVSPANEVNESRRPCKYETR